MPFINLNSFQHNGIFKKPLIIGSPFHLTSNNSTSPSNNSFILVALELHPLDSYKLNFDSSIHATWVAACVIILDHQDNIYKSFTYNLGNTQVFIAKVTTPDQGVLIAIQEKIQNLQIQGYILLIINVIQVIWSPPWRIAHIIHDIKTLLQFGNN